MTTLCGGYSEPKTPSEDSKNILTKNFESIVSLHENFEMLELDYLLENHTYSTQVVAGLNYSFTFSHGTNNQNYRIVIWKKLDGSFEVKLKV